MPELPEVETIKRGISDLTGQTIQQTIVRNPKLRYKISPTLNQELIGKKILKISRRAKYLILELSHGFLIIHLGMSGSLKLINHQINPDSNDNTPSAPIQKHDHVDICFNSAILRYNDPRRFGMIMYVDTLENCTLLTHLGPEPLDDKFSANYLIKRLINRKSTIKQLVMDNQIVVGVGNIYACEALFLAKIAPTRSGSNITKTEAALLVNTIKQVLTNAIMLGGSSLRDYKHADGNLGYFQNVHNVYAKTGQQCKVCNTVIKEQRLGQRNSFYCPSCQT
ncbi:MAG: formamidopyrimidine-DNA glycosylase [Pseudomonadota bacterium]|nr:formamidopyrimidine-DNA glycosylase [Pseudomonadota bacterium]